MNQSQQKPDIVKLSVRLVLFAAIAAAAALSACSATKQLGEMHDTTQDLDQQTHELNRETKTVGENLKSVDEKTSQLITTGTKLVDVAGTLLDDSKHGATLDLRTKLWPVIQEKQEVAARLTNAAKYQMAQDFQLWSGDGADTLERRDAMATSAIQEFLGDSQKLIKSIKIPVNPLSKDQKDAALNALVSTMEIRDRVQNAMLATHPNVKPMSLLTIIEDSLSHEKEIRAGRESIKDLPPYVLAVLQDRDIAIYLLETRYNYMTFVGMGSLIKDEQTPSSRFQAAFINFKTYILTNMCKIAKHAPKMQANIKIYDDEQVDRINDFLQGAIETRDFLKSIGDKPQLNCSVQTMIGLIDLSQVKSTTAELSVRRISQKAKLLSLVSTLKN